MSQSFTDLEPAEIANYKSNIVNYIISNAGSKLPMKYADLAAATVGKSMKLLKEILPHAKASLELIYGIKVFDEPGQKGLKKFICCYTENTNNRYILTSDQQKEQTLRFLILSYIFHKGGQVKEVTLLNILSNLGIQLDKEHDFFGADLKTMVYETFVKQLYLNKIVTVENMGNETTTEFEWGFRAHMEYNKSLMASKMAHILEIDPSAFNTSSIDSEISQQSLDSLE